MFRFFGVILLAAASLPAATIYNAVYDNGNAGTDGSYIIGPTQITLTGPGGTTTFSSMCFDFAEHIYSGEHYLATLTPLTSIANDPGTQARYDLAGFVYLAMHQNAPAVLSAFGVPNGASAFEQLQGLQYGVWDLFEPDESQDGNIYHGYAYTNEVDEAVDDMLTNSGSVAPLVAGLEQAHPGALNNLYVVQGVGDFAGIQKFIVGGRPPSGVPEPGSMGLMGGGLIGLAMLIRKRVVQ